jgi:hypothetical protein
MGMIPRECVSAMYVLPFQRPAPNLDLSWVLRGAGVSPAIFRHKNNKKPPSRRQRYGLSGAGLLYCGLYHGQMREF